MSVFIQNKKLSFLINVLISLLITFLILNKLKWLFIYFGIALIMVYFFEPFYKFLLRKRLSRGLSILITILIIIAALALFLVFVIPALIHQVNTLYKETPDFVNKYKEMLFSLEPYLTRFIEPKIIENLITENLAELQKTILVLARTIVISLSSIIPNIFLGLVIIPLILFYLLRDMSIFKGNLNIFVSQEKRKEFQEILEEIDNIISGFIRGRIIVCFIVGTLIGVSLYFLNLKFALIIGIIGGIFNFIPYLGPIIGLVLAIIFNFGSPWWTWLIIILVFLVVNQLEAVFLNPCILGKELGLHPLTVIFAILFCGQLLGVLGIIIAVPLAAILKVLALRYLTQEE
ncbi:MAG: AI-2E family transporter [Candidatus Caldatribacteriota bacterium]